MPANKDDLIRVLEEATEGLTYPSESDEPFDVVVWDDRGFAGARDALMARVDRKRPIEQITVEEFFAQLSDAENAQEYAKLQRVIEAVLSDRAIFRVGAGEVRVDIFLIGRIDGGRWGGLHTVSVET